MWAFGVDRHELDVTTIGAADPPEAGDGEVVLRVDRVGITANNVTYAVLGDAMRYWEFFPPGAAGLEPRWGLVPLWGFAEVVTSRHEQVRVGGRVYGYLPPAGHLLVRPGRVDDAGFRDESPHRAGLPSPYNAYRLTTGDPAYRPDREDLLVLFRPLFFTSFMLADQVLDHDGYGAEQLVLSSASSKTAYATAFELLGKGPRTVGLTAAGNKGFTESLGCYDLVLGYDEIAALPTVPTTYLDLSGSAATRDALQSHLGARLTKDIAVGLTTRSPNAFAAGEVFFAPTRIRKRTVDWGRDGLDARFAAAWDRFAEVAAGWVDVAEGRGAEGLRAAWLEVLAGRTPPRVGHVIQV
ncbi:DUF2855 family protein [Dactylosporangium sp. NPDC051541]|uniref:DUF2855 family protein n=1 Tax=Dactylosporangium sp. NPDC051541 TaxID=3363977 RepID=UPI0037AE0EA5